MLTNAVIFGLVAGFAVLISLLLDRKKTVQGVKKGVKMFLGIAPPFLNILILVSIVLFFIPPELIVQYLGSGSGSTGFFVTAVVGSITLIPGFIAFPTAALLLTGGAGYIQIAAFVQTLMMVGIVTIPMEIKYFSKKAAILRNIISFVLSIGVAYLIGLILKIWH